MRSTHSRRPAICALRPSTANTTAPSRPASLASYIAMSASASSSSADTGPTSPPNRAIPALAVVPVRPWAPVTVASLRRACQEVGRHPLGLGLVGLGQDHGELVAAQPGQRVAVAQALGQHRPGAPDQLVADRVAQRVVGVLEVVQVERDHGAGAVVALGGRQLAGEGGVEAAAG